MRKFRLCLLIPVTVMLTLSCNRSGFVIDRNSLEEMVIVLPGTPNSICTFTAGELNRHLRLIYGQELPVVRGEGARNAGGKILIGIRPPGHVRQLEDEEAVYVVQNGSLYLFGNDMIRREAPSDNPGRFGDPVLNEVLDMSRNRTGTLFSLYQFLENELGVTWIKPGDGGIFFDPHPSVTLPPQEVSWKPAFIQRNFRAGTHKPGKSEYAPDAFTLTPEESLQKTIDEYTWLRRMRFGYRKYYRFGHAFTEYWEKYGNSHPEIFALTEEGTREPMKAPDRIKMCPSSPKLVEIVIAEWLEKREQEPLANSHSIPGPENDTQGLGDREWCHCEGCRKLDAHLPGETLTDHLTDRYVYFWNSVANEGRKYQDDIMVTGYAYQETLLPPRKTRLHEGILIEFIPRMAGDFNKTRKLYEGWQKMGMKKMFFRPNDLNWELGISMGWEERLHRHLKLAIENGAEGTDFDSMFGHWDGVSDMAYFILAMTHVYPEATFEELENKFLRVFGDASEDIRAFYGHWRNIFNNKLIPADLALSDGIEPVYFEWYDLGKLTQRIGEFYSEEDFDLTDSYLQQALGKDLPDQARKYIERMVLSNRHSRLTYRALLAGTGGNREKMITHASALVDFRVENRDRLDLNWNVLFWSQHYHFYDQMGTRYLDFMNPI